MKKSMAVLVVALASSGLIAVAPDTASSARPDAAQTSAARTSQQSTLPDLADPTWLKQPTLSVSGTILSLQTGQPIRFPGDGLGAMDPRMLGEPLPSADDRFSSSLDPARLVTELGGLSPHNEVATLFLPLAYMEGAPAPEPPAVGWCHLVQGGPAGKRPIPIEMSMAHATVRQFSVESVYGTSDAALAGALNDDAMTASGIGRALSDYARGLSDVCAVPASADLPQAEVRVVDGVAIVRPGLGSVDIPDSAEAVIFDLRGFPAGPHLGEALGEQIALAISEPVARPGQWLRVHRGPTDEWYSAGNIYTNTVSLVEQPPFEAASDRSLPIVLFTGPRLAPEAALLAGTMRLEGRGWLAGDDVRAEVAEAVWEPVGDFGIAVRSAALEQVFRRQEPVMLRGQTIGQDDRQDPASAGWKRDLPIEDDDARVVDIEMSGEEGVDLDLFLMMDADENGAFRYPEEMIGYSAEPGANERINLAGELPPGDYQIWVLGWSVPSAETVFDIRIDVANGRSWPDVVAADFASPDLEPEDLVETVKGLGDPPALSRYEADRATPVRATPFRRVFPVTTGKAELRAALVIAHGMTRLFYPYFDVVGDASDQRLLETLDTIDTMPDMDRRAALNILRRFGEVLHDGHQFTVSSGDPLWTGYLPVSLDEIDGWPVVRRSGVRSIEPGDTIISIDGRSTKDWFAEEYTRTSAASPGYRFDLASRYFRYLNGPVTLGLRAPEGAERTVTVEPATQEDYYEVEGPPSQRPSGPLDDLDAPDLYYINLDGAVCGDLEGIRSSLDQAVNQEAQGLVVDMRGYPSGYNHYEVAQRLVPEAFWAPVFRLTSHIGATSVATETSRFQLQPLEDPAWDGPLVLLTGTHAVSAAENFMIMLVGADRPDAIVGRPSAATNGNITGVQLPGGFAFSYTGMEVLFPDASPFHGTGIVPDVPVDLTAEDFRDGVDRDLLTAIEVLQQGR